MVRTQHCLFLLAFLAGCQGAATSPITNTPATASGLSKDDQVRLAVFKYLLAEYERLYEKPDPGRLNAFYLSIGNAGTDKDPSDALMAAIGTWKYPVKKVSGCIRHLQEGNIIHVRCLDRATHKPGYLLWVNTIKWIDADTAELEAGHWEHGLGASGEQIKLHKKADRWEIVHARQMWVS